MYHLQRFETHIGALAIDCPVRLMERFIMFQRLRAVTELLIKFSQRLVTMPDLFCVLQLASHFQGAVQGPNSLIDLPLLPVSFPDVDPGSHLIDLIFTLHSQLGASSKVAQCFFRPSRCQMSGSHRV